MDRETRISRDMRPRVLLRIAPGPHFIHMLRALRDPERYRFYWTSLVHSPGVELSRSINSDAKVLAVVTSNLLSGNDSNTINSHRCDAAHIVSIDVNVTERICTQWHNSTVGDPNVARSLNSTDSDVLMARNLGKDNSTVTSQLDLDVYFVGTSGSPAMEPSMQEGIAIFPHTMQGWS
ncbi:hypothetical protein CPB84DRAFT_129386 [Gymnopilus junonius]|uniref:Uncharacterized protein n=1 Tax=Gymnopilus junonius TaxID=109634 RepID=A0A9P5TIP4_GYMJU|nr:hypothetical protein CPB84DRAFT_129386 [Gymnopilus junonius]